jgi:general secretion pathway protein M
MRNLNRDDTIALAALGLLVAACLAALAVAFGMWFDAQQALATEHETLGRVTAAARRAPGGQIRLARGAAPASAFLDASSQGLAAAQLQAYVAGLAGKAVLVSSGVQPNAHEDAGDTIRIEISFDTSMKDLQQMLYRLETGTPYVFVDSMVARPSGSTPETAQDPVLRVTLGLRAMWRRPA